MKTIEHDFQSEDQWLALRSQNIGSSEIEGLLGIEKYNTRFQLYHQKRGTLPAEDLSNDDRVFWGNHLEPAIAFGLAKLHELTIRKVRRYYTVEECPGLGARLDYVVVEEDGSEVPFEIKNVDGMIYRNDWFTDRDPIHPPLHIAVQLQHQMIATNAPHGYLGALIGGNDPILLKIPRHEKICAAILKAVPLFWEDVRAEREPEPVPSKDLEALQKAWAGKAVKDTALDVDTLPADQDDFAKIFRSAMANYAYGADLEKQGKMLKDEAKMAVLRAAPTYEKVFMKEGSINIAHVPEKMSAPRPAKLQAARRNSLFYPKKGAE